ncbi:MAG TPA: LuxR C-terminal-related transcriptional regulator, partial [Verrucomicrobiae bacterium]|nr:LuxR C-terminal-related transcriptional regulator [Verrucomicrobiae bacterium]
HQLFADVLRARLLDEQPDQVPDLHKRATEWYERNGERSEAIRHALAAGDLERAADLVELAIPALRQSRQEATIRRWLEALPDSVIEVRPVLSVHYAGALLQFGQLEGVEARLLDAERRLDTGTRGREGPNAQLTAMVVVDGEEFRRLPSAIALYRAALALAAGDVASTVRYARRVLDHAAEDDHLLRGSAAGLLGLADWTTGDLEEAHRLYTVCTASLEKAGYISDIIGCAISLADIRIAQGRLREAMTTYERGLQRAMESGAPLLRGAADMHVGMGGLSIERNDLEAARQHLLTSQELGEHASLEQNAYRWRIAAARLRTAEGDLGGALDLLDEAERQYVSDFLPIVRPIAALKTRVWVAQGRLGEALGWAREQGLSAGDDLSYLREFEHVTFARILLARSPHDRVDGSVHEAVELLERLLHAAEEGSRTGSVISILVLLALAAQVSGDIPAALAPLERALTLAQPEGYVRLFVDEGPSMAALLEAAKKRGIAPRYIRELLAAFGRPDARTPIKQALIESLSEREVDVLRLLDTDLDGPEIARQLVVSLHTVRSHTKSIYAKLGVNNRRAAVGRAVELDLLSRTRNNRPGSVTVHDA